MMLANQSPEPAAIGAGRSAVVVSVTTQRWLRLRFASPGQFNFPR